MNVVWFNGWEPILRTLLAGAVIYLVIITLLRIGGPRTLAKWYAFDLVVTVALGSLFANGVLSRDVAIAQAAAAFLLLVLLQYAIARAVEKFPKLVCVVNPRPVLLLAHGQLLHEPMRKHRVTRADVYKAVRATGRAGYEKVDAVVLEPDGQFSVIENVPDGASALQDVADADTHFITQPQGRGPRRSRTSVPSDSIARRGPLPIPHGRRYHPGMPSARKSGKTTTRRRWSQRVTETSDALDLDRGVFAREDPASIARSLKRSAERSKRRKADPFRSAMSMLVFYVNRAGKTLGRKQRAILERAKDELRRQFHRPMTNKRQ